MKGDVRWTLGSQTKKQEVLYYNFRCHCLQEGSLHTGLEAVYDVSTKIPLYLKIEFSKLLQICLIPDYPPKLMDTKYKCNSEKYYT